ncbi:MAG: hemin ABC transporter substrate-binding protein, partial [Corynebacterium nuruki]|nr:hemin ABC transporter substrate-binding protein [Corynebacterium nuruki]
MSVILSGPRRRPLAAVTALLLTVGLTACGVGSDNGGSVGDAEETSFDAAVGDFPTADDVPTASGSRDVSYAPYVGDVTPLTADPPPPHPVGATPPGPGGGG